MRACAVLADPAWHPGLSAMGHLMSNNALTRLHRQLDASHDGEA